MIENLVSTIIPVFNRPAMLREAVASVLEQTGPEIEIIVVDDGSTDDTPAMIEALAAATPAKVRSVRIVNAGPGPAREAGRRIARGEFIQYLDSDDRLLPGKFQQQVAALRRHSDRDIAYGYTRLVDENGAEITAPFKWTAKDFPELFPGLLVDRWWCTHTPLYRRRLTDAIGPWSTMRWSQDWQYDARAGALGAKLVNCHAYVSEHRHHSGVRQTSVADWQSDPVRLRNRLELLHALWSGAHAAGVDRSRPELQHFARWAFAIARQCAAVGLASEMAACLELAESAAGVGRGRRGVGAFRMLARLFGAGNVGLASRWLSTIRRHPGASTLPQSFSKSGSSAGTMVD